MVHHADRDPRPGDVFRSLAIVHHPRRLFRLAVWVFATALAPCLCASEARPSDQGIQVLGRIRPHHPRQALRPEGDRCSGPGFCTCDSAPPRRRPRLA